MKYLFSLSLLFSFCIISVHAQYEYVDPTGTYLLKGTTKKQQIMDHHGEIRVKLISEGKVAICLYINKGYPGYESGALMDTLEYSDNQVNFSHLKDPGCSVYVHFTRKEAEIRQKYSDPQSGCGFEKGVLISAVFPKTSGDIPQIQDLSRRGDTERN